MQQSTSLTTLRTNNFNEDNLVSDPQPCFPRTSQRASVQNDVLDKLLLSNIKELSQMKEAGN